MLPKKYRLPLRNLPTFFLTAARKHSPHFILYSAVAHQLETQVSIVAPAKRFPLAVDRNSAKRVISEAIKPLLENENQKTVKKQLVIYIKKPLQDSTFEQLKSELATLLR